MSKWISIKDKIPEDFTEVLVFPSFNFPLENTTVSNNVAFHTKDGNFSCWIKRYNNVPWRDRKMVILDVPIDGITHWCELPRAPYEVESFKK